MNKKFFVGLLATAALLLGGWGCAEQPGPIDQVETGLDALEQAENLSVKEAARVRREQDTLENLLPVAAVLLPGQDVPTEGIERISDEVFGCGEKIAYVRLSREAATDNIVEDAVKTLLAERDSGVGGLYNALWESVLEVDKVQSRDGVTTEVWIIGDPVVTTECGLARVKEQIEATVRQYRPNYTIYFNGTTEKWECLGSNALECK